MANYFVRKTGSDAAAGTSAGAAWLTLGKALGASGIASGDTVYVGSGVYRETVAAALTNPTALTRVVADTDGSHTGDAGLVRLTDYATDDKTLPTGTTALLDVAGRDYLRFEGFTFAVGGNRVVADAGTTLQGKGLIFQDCAFLSTAASANVCYWRGSTAQDTGTRFSRCRFFWCGSGNALDLTLPQVSGGVADVDCDVGIDSCFFHGLGGSLGSGGNAVNVAASLGVSFRSGGVRVANCTALVADGFFRHADASSSISPGTACEVYNSVIVACGTALSANSAGQLVEGNNHLIAGTARSNVTAGTGSVAGNATALLVNLGQELDRGQNLRPFFTPLIDSPYLGWGNTTPTAGLAVPTVDLLNRPRPSGGGPTWSSAASAIGCLERHDFAVEEVTTTDSPPSCHKLVGPGDVELHVPVGAVAQSLGIRCRWGSAYAGSLPQLVLVANGEIGVATQTVTAVGSPDTWYTLSLAGFTPTASGWVTLRLVSRSTAGTGPTYWDTASL